MHTQMYPIIDNCVALYTVTISDIFGSLLIIYVEERRNNYRYIFCLQSDIMGASYECMTTL